MEEKKKMKRETTTIEPQNRYLRMGRTKDCRRNGVEALGKVDSAGNA